MNIEESKCLVRPRRRSNSRTHIMRKLSSRCTLKTRDRARNKREKLMKLNNAKTTLWINAKELELKKSQRENKERELPKKT